MNLATDGADFTEQTESGRREEEGDYEQGQEQEQEGIGEMALVRAGVVGYISRPLTEAQEC